MFRISLLAVVVLSIALLGFPGRDVAAQKLFDSEQVLKSNPPPIFVDKDNTSGTEDGLSWTTAYNTIQEGIDAAFTAGGGEVWVAEGRYDELRTSVVGATDPPFNPSYIGEVDTGSLILKPLVDVYGGFDGTESTRDQSDWKINTTIIDGSTARSGQPAYHVILGADNAIIDGFTITGGHTRENDNRDPRSAGGGMHNFRASPTVAHCIFGGNFAAIASGLYCAESSAHVMDCIFVHSDTNHTFGGCGGMIADYGSSVDITSCTFVDNYAPSLVIDHGSYGEISGCIFTGNYGGNSGGGIAWSGISTGLVVNSLLLANDPTNNGGGAHIHNGSEVTFVNCTITENNASSGAALNLHANPNPPTVTLINTIYWDNNGGSDLGIEDEGTFIVQYSDVVIDLANPDPSNIWPPEDPLFIEGPTGTASSIAYNSQTFTSVLSDSSQSWSEGGYVDAYLFLGERGFPIIASTATSVTVWGDITKGGTVSAPTAYDIRDFRLQPESPCIDTGTSTPLSSKGTLPSKDLLGEDRLQGNSVDMGAFEYKSLESALTVEVEDGACGTPIEEANVELRFGANIVGQAVSDDNGAVSFPVFHGNYTVEVSAAGGKQNPTPSILLVANSRTSPSISLKYRFSPPLRFRI